MTNHSNNIWERFSPIDPPELPHQDFLADDFYFKIDCDDYFKNEISLPFGELPYTIPRDGPHRRVQLGIVLSRQRWEQFRDEGLWNPPGFQREKYPDPDPDAGEMPSWEDLKRGIRRRAILRFLSNMRWEGRDENEIGKHAEELSNDEIFHTHSEGEVYVGSGIGHMDSLSHLVARSQTSANEWPLAIMSEMTGSSLHLWTPSEANELLQNLSNKRNVLESAANLFRGEYRKLVAIASDEHGGLDPSASEEEKLEKRESAREKIIQIMDDIKGNISKYIDQFHIVSSGLPVEVDRAREVLKMRSGIIANRRRNEILNVIEAQDAFLPDGCLEQSQAVRRVSFLWGRANIMLDRANDIETMKSVFNTLQSDLNSIVILNTPVWTRTDGTAMVLNDDHVLDIEWDPDSPPTTNIVVDLTATSPPDITEGNEVAIMVEQTPHGEPHNTNIWFVRKYNQEQDGDNRLRVSLQYVTPHLEFPDESIVSLSARNVCGPSRIQVRVRRKQSGS